MDLFQNTCATEQEIDTRNQLDIQKNFGIILNLYYKRLKKLAYIPQLTTKKIKQIIVV
jgi:hypothetical protein